jgi:predicted dehydrogenase
MSGSQENVPRIDRRRFLRRSGGYFVAPLLGCQAAGAALAEPVATEKLNIGVVGVGNHGASNLAAMQGQAVVAVCDVDALYLEQTRQTFSSARHYRDWREMLGHPDLDAVVVSTPDHTHAGCAMGAMRKGLHVYCEKPLAHSIQETRWMEQMARQTGVVTQLGNQHHSSRGYRLAVRWLQAGVLGPIDRIVAWTNRPLWPQGIARPRGGGKVPPRLDWDLWLGPAPARRYHPAYHPLGWRGWWDFGSGVLGDMGPHLLDPVVAGLGLSAPDEVASRSAPVNRWTFPAWSIVRMKFGQVHRQQAAVELHWHDGGEKPPVELGTGGRLPANGVMLYGQRARMFIPDYGRMPRLLGDPADLSEDLPDLPGHRQQWIEACHRGSQATCDFRYAARLTEICLLGNISLRSGMLLRWDGDAGRIVNEPSLNQYLGRKPRPGWELPALIP